ncbi:MAG: hypothetical protein ING25_00035 [Burkholderiales bacterium]|jgi:hypothetical protein|nr:hypothetical protein [Burkholderiales bacterium]
MSLDLSFFKSTTAISVKDIDAYFVALGQYLSHESIQKAQAENYDSFLTEARLAAIKCTGLTEDFYEYLCANLENVSGETTQLNTYGLRLGDWLSVGTLSSDLRTRAGVGLEDLFPTAAAMPNELVLPDWPFVERKIRDLRSKLIASPPEIGDDDQLSRLLSAASDVFRQVGFNLPTGSVKTAMALYQSTHGGISKDEDDDLINAVDAMAESIHHFLQDSSSRYFLVWSN